MNSVGAAIEWMGTRTVLNLFVIRPQGRYDINFRYERLVPTLVREFVVDAHDEALEGKALAEYYVEFEETPRDLGSYLASVLTSAFNAGAPTAWFQFEGPFDEILAPDVSDQIYAIIDTSGSLSLALEDAQLISRSWGETIERSRRSLFKLPT